MKKFITFLLLGLSILGSFSSTPTLAQSSDMNNQLEAAGNAVGGNFANKTDVRITVANIIKSALTLIGFLVVVLIIYAGVLYMLSGGESEKKKKATDTISAAVIGLVIILTAYALTVFVTKVLLGNNKNTNSATSGPSGLQAPSLNSGS